MNKKISLVNSIRNEGDYISECIQSIIDFDYPNLEVIFVDRMSEDKTIDIIEVYKDRILKAYKNNIIFDKENLNLELYVGGKVSKKIITELLEY